MKIPDRRILLLILVLVAVVAAAAGWLALPRIQVMRADTRLAKANREIAAANEKLSGIDLDAISLESFISQTSIQQAGEALNASRPAVDDAIASVQAAIDSIDGAAGLYRLPESYGEYLEVKREVARLRIEQLETLGGMVEELQPFYDNGDIIFTSIHEMDRLWGQVEYHIQTLQNNPGQAGAGLEQAAASMRGLKDQIDTRNADSDFFLLDSLSESIGENAALADMARELADAVAVGDQARVQQAAAALEQQLLVTTDTGSFIDTWIEYSLEPDVDDYEQLQAEQEELDARAPVLFEERSRG